MVNEAEVEVVVVVAETRLACCPDSVSRGRRQGMVGGRRPGGCPLLLCRCCARW